MEKKSKRSRIDRDDQACAEWLEAQEGHYKRKCRSAFLLFLDFLREKGGFEDPTGDKILAQHTENRKSDDKKIKHYFDDLIPKFHSWLKVEYVSPMTGKPMTHNSASATVAPIRGFFAFHRASLELTKTQQDKIAMIEVRKKYHAFKHEELAKMARVANIEEKAVILLGTNQGIRVGDFVSQLRRPIIEAYKDRTGFPIEFEVETEKAGVIAVSHVTEETWQALQDYWANVPDSEYVFPSNGSHISTDRANDVLKATWLRAYPDREDAMIRFHELRSYKMSVLSNAGVNKWHVKRMVGKKLSPDILEYLTGIDLRADFVKAHDAFTLQGVPSNNHAEIEQLAQITNDLMNRVQALEETISALTALNPD